jgi:predicted transposase/invertase (TIGR01784 family)
MANHYDRIFKENIEPMIPIIAERVFGIEKIEKSEDLKDKLQYTLEKEADYLQKIIHDNPAEDYILHLECQVKDDPKMLSRMFLYRAILFHLFGLPVRQFILYIGKNPSQMNTVLDQERLVYSFQLQNVNQIEYEHFLASNVPEEVILAILADFKGNNPEQIIRKIVGRLKELSDQSLRLTKYEKQLEILSKLRNLQKQTIQTITTMGWEYELETDIRYLQGVEKGTVQGIEQGIERGIEQGKLASNIEFVKKLLEDSDFSIKKIASMVGVSIEFVEKIKNSSL